MVCNYFELTGDLDLNQGYSCLDIGLRCFLFTIILPSCTHSVDSAWFSTSVKMLCLYVGGGDFTGAR